MQLVRALWMGNLHSLPSELPTRQMFLKTTKKYEGRDAHSLKIHSEFIALW